MFIHKKSNRQSFTLVELMVVVALIVLLAGIGIGGYTFAMQRSRISQTEALIARISAALENGKVKHGFYPQQKDDDNFFLQAELDVDPTGDYKRVDGVTSGNFKYPEAYMRDYRKAVDMENLLGSCAKIAGDDTLYVVDAWGRPLFYRYPGKRNPGSFDLISAGPDGKIADETGDCWELEAGGKYTLKANEDTVSKKADKNNYDDLGNF